MQSPPQNYFTVTPKLRPNLRVILKCNGEFIYVKLISDIARLRGVVSLSCEERREGGGGPTSSERGGGSKAMYPR